MACIKQEFKYVWLWGFIIINNLPLDDTRLTLWEFLSRARARCHTTVMREHIWIANELWICSVAVPAIVLIRIPAYFKRDSLCEFYIINFSFVMKGRRVYKHDVVSRTTCLRASAISMSISMWLKLSCHHRTHCFLNAKFTSLFNFLSPHRCSSHTRTSFYFHSFRPQ